MKEMAKYPLKYRIAYKIVRSVITPFMLKKYSYTTEIAPKMSEPYLVLSNHTTERDMLMVLSGFPQPMYYVGGAHLFRTKLKWFITNIADIIPAPRGGNMMKPIKEILKRIKAGYSVIMFPEGCRSFCGDTMKVTMPTVKLLRKAGCALITYRLVGGYFVAPRWAHVHREGKVEGKVVGVYSSEQLAQMTDEEILELINRDIGEQAYETQEQKMLPYTCEALAEGLENYLIICPECGKYDTMVTEGHNFRCSHCGLEGTYTEYGYLEGENLPFKRVDDWGHWMLPRFDEDMEKLERGTLIFEEKDVLLYQMGPDNSRTDIGTGTLKVYHDRMEWEDRVFEFRGITAMSLLYFGKSFLFTDKSGYYGLTGEGFHAWKVERLAQLELGMKDAEL
ncbi:MAG: hypothetical protein E7225_01470 [Clostridiales bacterium]|nr:hypothetical protein [Clostridiales bacterium]